MVLVFTQTDEILSLPIRFLPIRPYAVSQSVAHPAVEVFEFAVNTCHTEVVHPSSLDFFKLSGSLSKRHWRSFPGDCFQVIL